MIGRYGPDQFYFCLFVTALVISFIARLTVLDYLIFLSYAVLFYAMFRFLSRNITARRRENDVFLRYYWPVKRKVQMRIQRLKERKTHRFFECPACKNMLRVPRGKGRIQITCPKCGERFEKKT
jgi:hypothetical protein